MADYVATIATHLLSGTRVVTLSGVGAAIGKCISCAEIVKRRIAGVYQHTKLDVIELPSQAPRPRAETASASGATVAVSAPAASVAAPAASVAASVASVAAAHAPAAAPALRRATHITITLSLDALDPKMPGYQAPLPLEAVQPRDDVGVAEHHRSVRARNRPAAEASAGPGTGDATSSAAAAAAATASGAATSAAGVVVTPPASVLVLRGGLGRGVGRRRRGGGRGNGLPAGAAVLPGFGVLE